MLPGLLALNQADVRKGMHFMRAEEINDVKKKKEEEEKKKINNYK